MATAGPVPALVDDLVEMILLRFPPDDPAALVGAALVCKGWRRLVSNPRFRRRFREFHRAAPMLGFLCSQGRFEPTTSFRPRHACDGSGVQIRKALDARHGRVLLSRYSPGSTRRESESEHLVVWDPVRGDLQTLPPLLHRCCEGWTAAVVCAAAGCDHLDCARGPFRVVFVGRDWMLPSVTSVWFYSSEVGAWSEHPQVAIVPPPNASLPINLGPSALVGNALYFRCASRILEHDLGTQVSVFTRPPAFFMQDPGAVLMTTEDHGAVLMTSEDGDLGLAVIIQQSKLVLWSREARLDSGKEDAGWAQSRVIELSASLPVSPLLHSARLVGFADGIGAILVQIVDRLFTIDVKSSRVKEIGKVKEIRKGLDLDGYHVVPFVSVCTPALEVASSRVGSGASASTTSQT